ncbi:MAG TPA: thioredoxin family protein [Gammaproteobacteria bacterium]|nr:thioredoxin family protein [Gammaproteobacteria bacterium]
MKVQLLVSEWCQSCHQAERVWREVADERAIDFQVVDMGQPEGRELVSRLRLKTVPSLVIEGELKGIGVQSKSEALELVAGAPEKAPTSVHQVGLGLALASRVAILSSVVYLSLAGAALPVYHGLFINGPARVAPLHVFTLGFVVFMIYGLGDHMLPRFTGNPIRMGAWPWAQLGLAHGGVWGLVLGFFFQLHPLQIAGGVAAWLALALFAFRLWPVLWPPARSGA